MPSNRCTMPRCTRRATHQPIAMVPSPDGETARVRIHQMLCNDIEHATKTFDDLVTDEQWDEFVVTYIAEHDEEPDRSLVEMVLEPVDRHQRRLVSRESRRGR